MTQENADDLSYDAKIVAGLFFPFFPHKVEFVNLSAHLTERCQAGLDELVEAGLVSETPIDGGVEYEAISDLTHFSEWHAERYCAGDERHKAFPVWSELND